TVTAMEYLSVFFLFFDKALMCTTYVPGTVQACVTVVPSAVVPSPKFQVTSSASSVQLSKVTVSLMSTVVLSAVKHAKGCLLQEEATTNNRTTIGANLLFMVCLFCCAKINF